MKKKSIEQIMEPPPPHMVGNGFRVHNFFPGGHNMSSKRMSPFFLLDYNSKVKLSPSKTPRGVGVHPHRGFETVTIAYHGKVSHHDSWGNSGMIEEGDVQWMTAASGLLHKEYHEKEFSKKGGDFQMVQLWVNLPAKDKMSKPKYQAIKREEMGRYELPDNGGTVEVIAGNFNGVSGPASTFTPVELYNLRLRKGTSLTLTLPSDYNTGLLIVEGSVDVNEEKSIPTDHFVLFRNDGEEIELTTQEDTVVLLLSGKPIEESLVAYGPFVMNSREEILQAYEDLNNGKFGILED